MDVSEIQAAVLECLKAVGVPRILKPVTYSISNVSAEVGVASKAKQNAVIAAFIASYDEYRAFRACANARGVWINASWRPFGKTELFVYEIVAVEMR